MDHSRDELRRSLKGIDRANDEAMAAQQRALAAAFEGDAELTADQRAGMLLGGLARRRFLTLGGFSVATAAVLAACGTSTTPTAVPQEGEAPPTSGLAARPYNDIVLLRTASSLEHNAIAAYEAAAGVLEGDALNVARLFQAHHTAHAQSLEQQTIKLGGEAYTKANPVVDEKVLQPSLALVKTPTDALQLAHALENVAAHTYQTVVPLLSQPALRGAIMSIGSIEARHAAVLAKVLGALPYPTPAAVPGAGPAPAPAATTTTVAGQTVVGPTLYIIPGSFEPLAATQVLLGETTESIDVLGPNSFMY